MSHSDIPRLPHFVCICLFAGMAIDSAFGAEVASGSVGTFDTHQDIGTVLHAGSASFEADRKVYTLAGSGQNMWAAADAFHFVYSKVSSGGDMSIAADISFLGTSAEPHRKACILIRQSLDPGSVYADIATHGDGLTSLQFRDTTDGATHEVQSKLSGPKRLRLEKRGDYLFMFLVAADGTEESMSGGSPRIKIEAPFYVGLGVCAHDKDRIEKAVFSNVELKTKLPAANAMPRRFSTLETITIQSTDRRVCRVFDTRVEAPNWTPDNKFLIYNSGGKLHRIAVDGSGEIETINSGTLGNLNNDHAISYDGKMLAISGSPARGQPSAVYTIPINGGTPKRITNSPEPSYFHGWSPDGKLLAFCGSRSGKFDIYTIPAEGGEETRLTPADLPNKKEDGPEYSPDGKCIYFNSQRTGSMQIWRMKPDGSEPEQLTHDDYENWFPHVSPNGRQIVFLTYDKGAGDHPADKDVMLRILDVSTMQITVLTKLFGGQGTINVPSWSPDSRRLAFVSYQEVP